MLFCSSCEFKISPNMRWAISKNSCPSCGGKIMNDSDVYEMKKIKSDIESLDSVSEIRSSVSSEVYSDTFESMINDLSMLFLFSIKKVVKNNLIQENKFNKRFSDTDDFSEDLDSDAGEDESFEARIRRQVEEEIGISSEFPGGIEDEEDPDEDDRVERLKKIHKKAQGTILKRTNKPITRIS